MVAAEDPARIERRRGALTECRNETTALVMPCTCANETLFSDGKKRRIPSRGRYRLYRLPNTCRLNLSDYLQAFSVFLRENTPVGVVPQGETMQLRPPLPSRCSARLLNWGVFSTLRGLRRCQPSRDGKIVPFPAAHCIT
jgi:hypothetical protein